MLQIPRFCWPSFGFLFWLSRGWATPTSSRLLWMQWPPSSRAINVTSYIPFSSWLTDHKPAWGFGLARASMKRGLGNNHSHLVHHGDRLHASLPAKLLVALEARTARRQKASHSPHFGLFQRIEKNCCLRCNARYWIKSSKTTFYMKRRAPRSLDNATSRRKRNYGTTSASRTAQYRRAVACATLIWIFTRVQARSHTV